MSSGCSNFAAPQKKNQKTIQMFFFVSYKYLLDSTNNLSSQTIIFINFNYFNKVVSSSMKGCWSA